MHKSKEFHKEITILAGAGGNKRLSEESSYNKQKVKSFHPPIENYWYLQPLSKERRPLSHLSFVEMLSRGQFKFKESFRRMRWSPSTKMVLEGRPHDPNDEKLIDSFRELLSCEGCLPMKHFDYHTLLRFLRMRDFDMLAAKDTFLQYLKWREDYGVDAICKEFKFEERNEVKKCYPNGFHGVDRCGRPVYIERIGMVDLDTFLKVTTMERFIKNHVCEQEKTMNWRFPACSIAAKKHIASTLSILDVKNVGTSQFSKPARQLFLEIQKIDSNYYPETLHQLFIINAGTRFKVVWKAIRAFLDARTLAKIRVLGGDYKKSLFEVIDPSNLPSFFGGNCTCSDQSGGCLFSDKGPWNDPQISEMLKGMLENGEEQKHDLNPRDAAEKVEFKDIITPSTLDDDHNLSENIGGRKDMDVPLLHKIQAFEPVLDDAKEKIKMLEAALQDTMLALQGLEQHIEELKLTN